MELDESIKLLEEKIEKGKELDTRNNPMSDIIDEIIIENKAIDTVIKYIKEESIPKAVVEEKIEKLNYSYKNIEKNYTEEQLDNYDVSEEDYIEMKKREFAERILQEILNEGK